MFPGQVRYEGIPKRVFDFLGAAILLLFCLPLMLAIYCLIRLTGPALYKQKRVTQHGRIFTMYKFRTMIVGAESKSGPVWTCENDVRVTKLGSFLRRTRIDELPQLINVLRGEMSLIGPRPERPEIAQRLQADLPLFVKRLAVKGGITGLAQAHLGYSDSLRHYRRKVKLDAIYVDNCCLLLDIRIALRTVFVVVGRIGAQ